MKRIPQFKHLLLISATLLTIGSCGNPHENNAVSFSTSQALSETQNLTSAERIIATRVCYAYQSKSNTFKTQTYFGGSYSFNLTTKSCENVRDSYTAIGILGTSSTDTTTFAFTPNTTKQFEKKIQTANSGFLAQLCTKIQNNLPVSNTAVVDSVTVQISFATISNMDSYTLKYFASQNNVMKIQSSETFKVRTFLDAGTNQILGMDEQYSKQAVCPTNSANFTEFTQNYSGFTSK